MKCHGRVGWRGGARARLDQPNRAQGNDDGIGNRGATSNGEATGGEAAERAPASYVRSGCSARRRWQNSRVSDVNDAADAGTGSMAYQ